MVAPSPIASATSATNMAQTAISAMVNPPTGSGKIEITADQSATQAPVQQSQSVTNNHGTSVGLDIGCGSQADFKLRSGIAITIEAGPVAEVVTPPAAPADADNNAFVILENPVTYTVPPGTTSILKASPRSSNLTSSNSAVGSSSSAAALSTSSSSAFSRSTKGHVSILEPIMESRDNNNHTLHGDGSGGAHVSGSVEDHDEDGAENDRKSPSPIEQMLMKGVSRGANSPMQPTAVVPTAESSNANNGNAMVAGSVKTVSFSMVNQTIESNNTIRTSSISMAINHPVAAANINIPPPPGAVSGAGVPVDTSATMPIVTVSTNINNRIGSVSSSFRPNLHLEMSSLAASVSMQSPTRYSSSMKSHSVRLHENPLTTLDHGALSMSGATEDSDSNAQQELTDKAVVVIRRVMDKLTGLDFHDHANKYVSVIYLFCSVCFLIC